MASILLMLRHIIQCEVAQQSNAKFHPTFINEEVRGMMGGGFCRVHSFRHSPQEEKQAWNFLSEERKVFGTRLGFGQDHIFLAGNGLEGRQHSGSKARVIISNRIAFFNLHLG